MMRRMPSWVWWAVLLVNSLAFAAFGFDKWRASRGGRRIREATLLWLVFLCGCVGAEIGARVFHHKTRKVSFRWRALALTAINPLWWLVYREFAG